MQHVIDTKFYTFRQNNSGGKWRDNHSIGIGRYVIVEALDDDDAITRAENIGLYFDGVGDCSCCGNRWSSYVDGEEFPEVYGESYIPCEEKTDTFIHDFDGSFTFAKEVI